MSSLVNKNEKRKCIALSCKKILLEKRFKNLTITELAKEANIGKGTVYEYFENKEDIVLELNSILYENYKLVTHKKIENEKNIRLKIELFFSSIYDDEFNSYRRILKEFIGISYSSTNNSVVEFQKKWYKENFEYLKVLIQDSVDNKKLIRKRINIDEFVDSMINTMIGFVILSFFTKTVEETKEDIKKYILNIFRTKF